VAAEEEAMADIMEEAGIAGRERSIKWQGMDGIKADVDKEKNPQPKHRRGIFFPL